MLKAETDALLQAQNIGVLETRQAELEYYVNVYNSIGTQAALIAGFTITSVTSIDLTDLSLTAAKGFYFILNTVTLCSATQCILSTIFTVVCGPGLALRGPEGSMVRAVNGMLKEQTHIFRSFIVSILFFAASTAATFWVIMSQEMAIVCTIIVMISSGFWYHYCLRIFNRFSYNVAADLIDRPDEGDAAQLKQARANKRMSVQNTNRQAYRAAEEHIGHGGAGVTIGEGGHGQDGGTRNPISAYAVDSDDDDDTHAASVKAQARRTMKNGGGDDGGAGTIKPSFGKRLSVGVSNLMGFTATNMTAEQGEAGRDGVAQNDIDVLQNSSSIMLMGYLSHNLLRADGDKKSGWNRYFFVLDDSDLYCYKNELDFEKNRKAVFSRPLDIRDHDVRGLAQDEEKVYRFLMDSYDEKSASMLKSQILSQLAESRLLIVLAPIEQTAGPGGRGKDVGEKGTARRATVLKLDTDDEFSRWLKALGGQSDRRMSIADVHRR